MITHGVDEFMDDLRRTWCGINLEPMDPRPADDAVVDCMSCLVAEARRCLFDTNKNMIGRVISVHPDGAVTIEIEMEGIR